MSDTDDYSSTPSTSGTLTVGGSTLGTFERQSDSDWFRIHLNAGTSYVFAMTSPSGVSADLSGSILTLYDANQAAVVPWTLGGNQSGPAIQYKPAADGDYFLSAQYSMYPEGAYTNIRYAVSAAIQQADALSADIHTTGVLAPGGAVTGRFDVVGDMDWYKFHAEAGQHYFFGHPGNTVEPTVFEIYDANGKALTESHYPLEPTTSGDYFIAVGGNLVGDYTLRAYNQVDDYSTNDSSAGVLLPGGQATGKLNYAFDQDRFNIRLTAGQAYKLDLSGDARDNDILSFEVLDEQGKTVVDSTSSPDGVSAPSASFKASTSGTYAVIVTAADTTQTGHGPYTLKASNPIADDYGETMSGAAQLTLGSAIGGTINFAGDVDVVKVALQAGTTYLLALGDTPARYRTWLTITDQDGQHIKTHNDTPANTSFTPNATGDYYITVAGDQGSTYTLVATAPTDDWGANAGAAGKLAAGGVASGMLERSGDRDWFAITMDAGATYEMALKKAEGSALFSSSYATTLNVVDAQGHVLTGWDSSQSATGPQLSYRAAASGTYYIEVAAGLQTGGYVVSAALGTPDDVGNLPADATRLDPGLAFSGKLAVPSDKDVFKLAVVAGQYYGFQLEHAPGGQMPDLLGTDAQQRQLDVDTLRLSYSDNTYQVYHAKASGDIYLTVSESPKDGANDYQLSATSLGGDDYERYFNAAGAASLAVGAQLNGTLNYAGDVDTLKVTLQQGESYMFTMQSSATQGLNVKYGYGLSLYNAQGSELGNFRGALGGSFDYKAASSGDYYLSVQASVTDINATGGYTLAASKKHAAPQLAAPPASGTAAGIHHFLALDFDERIQVANASGIVLKDAAGKAVNFDRVAAGQTDGTHLDLATQSHLTPGASYTLDIAADAIRDMAGNYFAGLHTSFTTVAAASAGTNGNDLLLGRSNGAAIHGGAGVDTAIYASLTSQYTIVQRDGHAEISKLGGGKDILDGVERLSFQDQNIALDVDGVGGQAYRLYQAAFNRAPDLGGLGFWINAMDKGLSMMAAAGYFADSAEFQKLYGSKLSDDAYVTQLYSNVLHRAPDAGGKEYWLQALHNGTSRGDALGYFSDSPENQAALIGQISNGFEYIPAAG